MADAQTSTLAPRDPATRQKWYRRSSSEWLDARWLRLTDRAARGLELARSVAKLTDLAEWLDDEHFRTSIPLGYGDTLDELEQAAYIVRGPEGQPMLDPEEWALMQRSIDASGAARQQRYRDRLRASAPRPRVVGASEGTA